MPWLVTLVPPWQIPWEIDSPDPWATRVSPLLPLLSNVRPDPRLHPWGPVVPDFISMDEGGRSIE